MLNINILLSHITSVKTSSLHHSIYEYTFILSKVITPKRGDPLLLNLLSYERPAGFPPLIIGQFGVCGAPHCPKATTSLRVRAGGRYYL